MDSETLEQGVLLRFHEQFAQNQNHHQSLIVQLLAAIAVLLAAYGYASVNEQTHVLTLAGEFGSLGHAEPGVYRGIVSPPQFIALSLVVSLVLSCLFAYVCQAAYGFRRDMLVIWRVRRVAGPVARKVFSAFDTDDDHGKFPTWAPELFIVLLCLVGAGALLVPVQTFLHLGATWRHWYWLLFLSSPAVMLGALLYYRVRTRSKYLKFWSWCQDGERRREQPAHDGPDNNEGAPSSDESLRRGES